MKSMNDNNNTNGYNNNSSNWLGFSLSPQQMKMEVANNNEAAAAASSAAAAAVQNSSFYMSTSPFNASASLCFGCAKDGAFHASLPVMPLKSDGSLCIPQGIMQGASPKLEDFLGGAAMEAHQYGNNESETMMGLSLDSVYYHQQNTEHEADRQFSVQTQSQYYNALPCNTQLEEDHCGDHSNLALLKNWVTGYYYTTSPHTNALDQHQQQITTTTASNMVTEGAASFGPVSTVGCGGDLQSLTLSMSPGSQSSCVTAPTQISGDQCVAIETKKRGPVKLVGHKQPVHRKSIDTFGQRTSQYRGVTRHRWTGRYEAHLWDNSCKKEGQTRKGRQVYLGGYDMEEKAARAYDLAALKYWGPSTHINFPLENYKEELEGMKNMSRQEYVAHLRRKSSGFSRGASMFRGVTRHHQHGRWQARIGRVAGNKDLYLGTFSTQEEAAEAYDIAAIKFRGVSAVTNFDITRYDVDKIIASNTLLGGESARRNKIKESTIEAIEFNPSAKNSFESAHDIESNENAATWKMVLYQTQPQQANAPCHVDPIEMHDLIGMESAHFSNPSSIVTSLSSSREGSPDRSGTANMLFAKPPLASKFISPTTTTATTTSTTWYQPPTAHLRPEAAVSMAHLPVFAAWGDS